MIRFKGKLLKIKINQRLITCIVLKNKIKNQLLIYSSKINAYIIIIKRIPKVYNIKSEE